jgi:hypothetical protein
VLDAVGTEGGSGTAFIVITDDDIVTHKYYHWCSEHIKYNHSESSLKMYSKLDKLFRLNYIQLLIAW